MKTTPILISIGASLLLLIALGMLGVFSSSRPFDREVWIANEGIYDNNNPRLGMADYLIAERTLIGMDSSAVIEMLGQPSSTGYFSEYDLFYLLGPERGLLSFDSELLAIKFDDSGKVVSCLLVRD